MLEYLVYGPGERDVLCGAYHMRRRYRHEGINGKEKRERREEEDTRARERDGQSKRKTRGLR